MTGITAASTAAASLFQRQNPFTRIDTDQSGTVTKDEFVAGRPRQMSEAEAAELYAKIDADGTNALTDDQLKAGMEANRPASPQHRSEANGGLAESVLSALIGLVQQMAGNAESPGAAAAAGNGRPTAAERFADMDVNGDGSVTKAEFIAARPDRVSEEDATSFYDRIDTEGTGSITLAQFEDARPANGPGRPHGPPPGPPPSETASTGDATTASSSETATGALADQLNRLMEAIKAYASSNKIDVASLAETLTAA